MDEIVDYREDGFEEEYDALNDETFGDDGEEYNWEQSQKLFQDWAATKPRQGSDKDGNSGMDNVATADDSSFWYDEGNTLEESISRMVFDDYDDDCETQHKSKRGLFNKNSSSSSTYFTPPQVASKHLEWYVDKEFPGVSTLFGSTVWSMEPNTAIQKANSNSSSNKVSAAGAYKPEHLEKDLKHLDLKPGSPIHFTKGPPDNIQGRVDGTFHDTKAVFKTLDEIEKEQLLSSKISDSKPGERNDGNKEPKPKFIFASDLEKELMESSNILEISNNNVRHQVPSLPFGPNESLAPMNNHMVPKQALAINRFPQQAPMKPLMLNDPRSYGFRATNKHPHLPALMPYTHVIFPPNMPPRPGMDPRARHLVHVPGLARGPMVGGVMPVMNSKDHYASFPRNSAPPQALKNMMKRDPYAGLMNAKDKQRIKNIQIIQLQNDHPFVSDYYYFMSKMKNLKESKDPNAYARLLLKLFPKQDDQNSRKKFQPALFENCLGKLQPVSALAPKKAIDIVVQVKDSGRSRSGVKHYRYLLLDIERVYELLLKIEETDVRCSLVSTSDDSDATTRKLCIKKILNILQGDKLLEVLRVKKGRMAVFRLLILINGCEKENLLSRIFSLYGQWTCPSDEYKHLFPYVSHGISSLDIKLLCTLVTKEVAPRIDRFTSNQLFFSILMLILNILGQNASTAANKQASQLFLYCFRAILQSENVPVPINVYVETVTHCMSLGIPESEIDKLKSLFRIWIIAGCKCK